MLTASTQVSYSMRANFLGGQNKGLIRTGDANPPQILKLCDAERRFVPKIELLACNEGGEGGVGGRLAQISLRLAPKKPRLNKAKSIFPF